MSDPEKWQLHEPLRLVHHHPGYLRAQANAFVGKREDDPILSAAKNTAERAEGFRKWSHSPKTGSIVIEYEPGNFDPDRLLARIAKRAGFQSVIVDVRNKGHRKDLVNGVLNSVREVNQIVSQSMGNKADLREVVPAALVGVSIVSFLLGDKRGGRLPRWDSALYRSYRIFMQWHRKEVRDREKAARKIEERLEEARQVSSKGN